MKIDKVTFSTRKLEKSEMEMSVYQWRWGKLTFATWEDRKGASRRSSYEGWSLSSISKMKLPACLVKAAPQGKLRAQTRWRGKSTVFEFFVLSISQAFTTNSLDPLKTRLFGRGERPIPEKSLFKRILEKQVLQRSGTDTLMSNSRGFDTFQCVEVVYAQDFEVVQSVGQLNQTSDQLFCFLSPLR